LLSKVVSMLSSKLHGVFTLGLEGPYGSGIFSPADLPLAGLKPPLPHQYKRLSSLRKEPVILDDYIFPVPLEAN